MPALDLETTYLSLDGQGAVASHPVGPDFWATIDRNPDIKGTLITAFEGETDWPHWEMHPAGDEILLLLDGRLTLLVEEGGVQRAVEMTAGSTFVVPAGAWHRAVKVAPHKLVAITYGAGTTHRPA
jgi:mannose-6-phosphate isomerase-like protein (cupin superfamily)